MARAGCRSPSLPSPLSLRLDLKAALGLTARLASPQTSPRSSPYFSPPPSSSCPPRTPSRRFHCAAEPKSRRDANAICPGRRRSATGGYGAHPQHLLKEAACEKHSCGGLFSKLQPCSHRVSPHAYMTLLEGGLKVSSSWAGGRCTNRKGPWKLWHLVMRMSRDGSPYRGVV